MSASKIKKESAINNMEIMEKPMNSLHLYLLV